MHITTGHRLLSQTSLLNRIFCTASPQLYSVCVTLILLTWYFNSCETRQTENSASFMTDDIHCNNNLCSSNSTPVLSASSYMQMFLNLY